jgi:FkbM family methyltransferase
MIQNLRHGGYLSDGPVLDKLVFWNGNTIVHPPQRGGLMPILLELWYDNTYRIGEFYTPKPGDLVLDVGAHIGLFTLRILDAEPRCRVIAVEPSRENFACLKSNIALLGGKPELRLLNLGVGGSFGKIKMREIPTNRSFDARTMPADQRDAAAVDVVPLAHLFSLAGEGPIALLKMDIEGGEYAAFSTADAKLFQRVERFAMEYHDNYVPGTLALLQERLSPTHQVTAVPDPGQLNGRLFAVRNDLVGTLGVAASEPVARWIPGQNLAHRGFSRNLF